MPQKIRELVKTLELAGFVNRGGKGSHRNYEHATGLRVTLSGSLGNDAKPYQVRIVQNAMKELEQ